jgi:hypothetical protein
MKRLNVLLIAVCLVALYASGASANGIYFDLAEWATYKDGAVSDYLLNPNEPFASKSFTLTFSGAGAHAGIVFVDPEISQDINTFFNEYGAAHGALAAGQSWEIDEPGYVYGDIFTNLQTGSLDNSNGVPSSTPDDVAMALGWDFVLNPGESATLNFFLNTTVPTSGFYLSQTDADNQGTLYFSSTLDIRNDGGPTVPEPSTFALLGSAVAGLAFYMRRRERRE